MKPILTLLLILCVHRAPVVQSHAAEPSKPNVLFIAIDDLRDLSAFPNAKVPNLDRLAAMGMKFTRAYCAAQVCNASRCALMSGLRPSTTGVYENNADGRNVVASELSLTTAFRNAGYFVCGAGKIYHEKFNRQEEWDAYLKNEGHDPAPQEKVVAANFLRSPLDCADSETQDARIVDYGVHELGKKHDKPFFLAFGLHKPHSPWNVPRKYYEQYLLKSITLPPYLKGDIDDLPPAGQHMAKWAGTLLPTMRTRLSPLRRRAAALSHAGQARSHVPVCRHELRSCLRYSKRQCVSAQTLA